MNEKKIVEIPPRKPTTLLLLSLCTLNIALTFPLPGLFSYVYNENGRLASGLIHLKTGDFSVFHVNPPIPDMVGAVPAWLANHYCPTRSDLGFSQFGRKEHEAGEVWIKKNPDHSRWMKYGRMGMLAFVLFGTISIFFLTKELFNIHSAVIACLTWMLSPYIIGFGCLVCPDVASAALSVTAVFFLWKWLREKSFKAAFWGGIVLGIAELCKFTLLILYPLFVLLWILYRIPDFKSTTKQEWK